MLGFLNIFVPVGILRAGEETLLKKAVAGGRTICNTSLLVLQKNHRRIKRNNRKPQERKREREEGRGKKGKHEGRMEASTN